MKMNEFISSIAKVVRDLKELHFLRKDQHFISINNNKYCFNITLTFDYEDAYKLCLRMLQELNNNDFEMKISYSFDYDYEKHPCYILKLKFIEK